MLQLKVRDVPSKVLERKHLIWSAVVTRGPHLQREYRCFYIHQSIVSVINNCHSNNIVQILNLTENICLI